MHGVRRSILQYRIRASNEIDGNRCVLCCKERAQVDSDLCALCDDRIDAAKASVDVYLPEGSPDDFTCRKAHTVGPNDADPEDLITFVGAKSEPIYQQDQDTKAWRRARVMIDFFGLNRDGLVERRAWWLLHAVWPNFKLAEQGAPEGGRNLARICSERAPFTNCAKCFLTLCETNRYLATSLLPEFEKIVESMET